MKMYHTESGQHKTYNKLQNAFADLFSLSVEKLVQIYDICYECLSIIVFT